MLFSLDKVPFNGCKDLPSRTQSTRSVEPLGDIPVMTKMILCRGKASACLRDLPTPAEAGASRRQEPLRRRQGRYLLTMALFLLVHLLEFTPRGFGLYPLHVNKTRRLKP